LTELSELTKLSKLSKLTKLSELAGQTKLAKLTELAARKAVVVTVIAACKAIANIGASCDAIEAKLLSIIMKGLNIWTGKEEMPCATAPGRPRKRRVHRPLPQDR